jgi:hypothetical protein
MPSEAEPFFAVRNPGGQFQGTLQARKYVDAQGIQNPRTEVKNVKMWAAREEMPRIARLINSARRHDGLRVRTMMA